MSNGFSKSSVGKKILMALSGFFLLLFLFQHFIINLLSIISADAFNNVSFFMGTNPIVQFAIQPILLFGVVFHLIMGITLELKNKAARPIQYAMNKPNENSSWMSRNMVITGIMVLLFLGLHFYDFWIPEIKTKFIEGNMSGLNESGELRFHEELVHKFIDPIRVVLYVLSFVFLSLHLLHGFQSAFQSVGFNHKKYTPIIKKLGKLYAIIIPLGFVIIALFHFFNH
ncbi:MAG: succinate dehydrogenase [Bacteroidetes bacterium HGW-Bacteroidetes-12]|nr:MAG: succinate dehydrogenase [Bacteroidetes bacterium HGW-Bacteroidetes-12]